MLSEKVIIEYNKLLKIRDQLSNLLQGDNNIELGANSKNIKERQKIDSSYGLDDKENEILDCIRNNPGINKENVINKIGKTSRQPIINRIKKLEQFGYIIVKINEKNSQSYKLYYNDENSLAILIKDLNTYKKSYFLLIDSIKENLIDLHNKCQKQLKLIADDTEPDNGDTSCGQLQRLIENVILPFRNLILILLYSNFISINIRSYNENTILQKFLIINNFIKDVFIKLINIFPKKKQGEIDMEISVIHGLEIEMLPSSIEKNINFFKRYNLKERVEELWESLWKIVSPFLPKLFHFYLQINGIIKRNSVNSLRKLLNIKSEYTRIEKYYAPSL
jgi:hypothetical protein